MQKARCGSGAVGRILQAVENLASVAQQVILDVKTQLREVFSSYAEIAIRERVRLAAAAYFEGIIQIEDVRARTPEFLNLKLDSQAQLANAEQALIQAIVNYNLAIMHLEQAKGTLLEFDQISLDRPAPRRRQRGTQLHPRFRHDRHVQARHAAVSASSAFGHGFRRRPQHFARVVEGEALHRLTQRQPRMALMLI